MDEINLVALVLGNNAKLPSFIYFSFQISCCLKQQEKTRLKKQQGKGAQISVASYNNRL